MGIMDQLSFLDPIHLEAPRSPPLNQMMIARLLCVMRPSKLQAVCMRVTRAHKVHPTAVVKNELPLKPVSADLETSWPTDTEQPSDAEQTSVLRMMNLQGTGPWQFCAWNEVVLPVLE